MTEEAQGFLRDCVIQSTLDDYENIETLAGEISRWAKEEKQTYSFEALVNVIQKLTNEGLLKSYRFSQPLAKFVDAEFNRDALQELWFLAINK